VQEHLSEIQKGATQEVLITSQQLVLHLAKMLRKIEDRKDDMLSMNKIGKIVVVAALAIVVGMVVVAKQDKASHTNTAVKNNPCICVPADSSPVSSPVSSAASSTEIKQIKEGNQAVNNKLPQLVDLGASSCIPCKMMVPILEDIKKEYAGRLKVVFIDVRENPDAGREYGIRIIPTQIFYNASDNEMFRHEGFMSKKDILAKWKDLGVNLAMEKQ